MGFIYKVTNTVNQKVYIGQTSRQPHIRWQEHCSCYRETDKQYNTHLHRAIRKYGKEAFTFEVIERNIPNDKLDEREQYWIKFYDSYNNGYNMTIGGLSRRKYDYEAIKQDYLKTKSKQKTAENFNCDISTVMSAVQDMPTFNKNAGIKITGIHSETHQEVIFDSIKQAAEWLAEENNKNAQTIRKRITNVINNHPEQKAYGYFWKKCV